MHWGHLLGSNPELKRTRVETNVPRKLTVTARTIFPPPHKAQMVSEGEAQGRHLDTGGGVTRKHDRRGPNGQLPRILDRQRRLSGTLRDHVRSASAFYALKKSLVANLSAKRQLSVAKLSAKRIFSLAKRDFLVANGRMAADFSSPVVYHACLFCRCKFADKAMFSVGGGGGGGVACVPVCVVCACMSIGVMLI